MFETQKTIDMAMLAEEKGVSVDWVSTLCQLFEEGFGFRWESTINMVRRCLDVGGVWDEDNGRT